MQKMDASSSKEVNREGDPPGGTFLKVGDEVLESIKRVPASLNWCYTWNNYDETILDLWLDTLKNKCKKWIYGKEVGENGTPHLQGYIELKTKGRPIELFRNISNKIHWEKAGGDLASNSIYCMKEGNFIDNYNAEYCFKPQVIPDPFGGNPPMEWQQKVIDLIKNTPDERTINWYWSDKGKVGKSALQKWIKMNYFEVATKITGGVKDGCHLIAKRIEEKRITKIVMFNFSRSREGRLSYELLETIKDGYFASSKYEGGEVLIPSPHVLCFANFAPDEKELSEDRWVIYKID